MDHDFIARFVSGYGYLPILKQDGKEIYRGEFQRTAIEAIEKCQNFIEKVN